MSKYTITIEGDFEKGECLSCPLLSQDNGYGVECYRAFEDCPLEEVKQNVSLREVYRLIAGHSNYHGDSILAAFTCVAEGKEVKPIRPLEEADVTDINVGNKVKQGEWILIAENSTGNLYRCSVCTYIHNPNKQDVFMGRMVEKPKFCPNCGTPMKGGN